MNSLIRATLVILWVLPACLAKAQPCALALNDITSRREAIDQFVERIKGEEARLQITEEDIRNAKVSEFAGVGQKKAVKVYILSSGEQSWWFADYRKYFRANRAAGRLDIFHSDMLEKIAGSELVNTANHERFELDQNTRTFVKFSNDITAKFDSFVTTLREKGDPTAGHFLDAFGKWLLLKCQTKDVDLDDLSEGEFSQVIEDHTNEKKGEVFIFLPRDRKNPGYFFARHGGTRYFRKSKEVILGRDEIDLEQRLLRFGHGALNKRFISNRSYQLNNHQHLAYFESNNDDFLSILNKPGLAAVKKIVAMKDALSDQFENGPYQELAKYLSDFIKFNNIARFPKLKDIEIVGQGYSITEPTKMFTVFVFNNRNYFYTLQKGKPVFDRYWWNNLNNNPRSFYNYDALAAPAQKMFFKLFGHDVMLPTQQRLTLLTNIGQKGFSVSVSEGRSGFDDALEQLENRVHGEAVSQPHRADQTD